MPRFSSPRSSQDFRVTADLVDVADNAAAPDTGVKALDRVPVGQVRDPMIKKGLSRGSRVRIVRLPLEIGFGHLIRCPSHCQHFVSISWHCGTISPANGRAGHCRDDSRLQAPKEPAPPVLPLDNCRGVEQSSYILDLRLLAQASCLQ
jgi:hypothetical protein